MAIHQGRSMYVYTERQSGAGGQRNRGTETLPFLMREQEEGCKILITY